MKPNCPISQWEHTFATEYCQKIKSLGKMWRKSPNFGNKTLLHFRGVAFNLCAVVKTFWFPGCIGANYEDCKKFLFCVLDDWKDTYKNKKIKGYPVAYLFGMIDKEVRAGDLYFEALKQRKGRVERAPAVSMVEALNETFKDLFPKEWVEKKRNQLFQYERFEVLKRDNFRCRYCGRDVNDKIKLHVDHIKPLAKGGSNEMDNLITSCEDCNIGKGVTEFEKLIEAENG